MGGRCLSSAAEAAAAGAGPLTVTVTAARGRAAGGRDELCWLGSGSAASGPPAGRAGGGRPADLRGVDPPPLRAAAAGARPLLGEARCS